MAEKNQDDLPSYELATGIKTLPLAHMDFELHVEHVGTNPVRTTVAVPPPPGLPMSYPSAGLPPPAMSPYASTYTQEKVTPLLPPDHLETICMQEGKHVKRTKFGTPGLLAGIFWFPFGIGLCMLDRRVHCTRCGEVIQTGCSR